MTVKDLILANSAEEVYDVFCKMYLNAGELNAPDTETAHREFCEFYNKLKTIEPTATENVILVHLCYDSDGVNAYPEASMFKKADLTYDMLDNSPLKGITVFDVNFMPYTEIKRLHSNSGLPTSYGFEYSPWAEGLGTDVSETNICAAGSLKALSAILYEMSLFGYDEETIAKEYEKLFESFEEESSEQDIEDNNDNDYVEDDFGRSLIREGFRTMIAEYKALAAYLVEQHIK